MVVRQPVRSALMPPLKWAGGKRWLVPRLATFWAQHRDKRLVEPFVGGLAVALGLQPKRALLNDTNMPLIDFYSWLQRGLVTTIAQRNEKALFYEHRQRFNDLLRNGDGPTDEAAALFAYLNRTCFNGLCRFNRRGEFNVPFGKYRTIQYRSDWRTYVQMLEPWQFRVGDFTQLALGTGDFIYADPPYDVPFRSYTPGGFDWEDQVRLAEWLAEQPGPVVASNQATERIVALYTRLNFSIEYVDGPRMIACTGNRTPAREILATRNTEGGQGR
ncbi:MAG: Dam family site-specific DNA-(adenine-N6)-methyltransferase [Herpetosiphon sp.]